LRRASTAKPQAYSGSSRSEGNLASGGVRSVFSR
jgi:hypothetical protein